MSGTGHSAVSYPNDLPNRTSTGILKKPTVIDRARETGHSTTFKIKKSRSLPMPTRRESARARERLRLATPICDDASLVKVEEEFVEYLREANRRDALADKLLAEVVDAIARSYFRHILRKQERVTPVLRRTRA
jgi:hypothetical protein